MSADTVSRGFAGFLSWVAEPAARALALGCFAGAALAIFRVKRVSARLGAWTAVLYLALAMPLLGLALPHVQFAVPSVWIDALHLPALLRAKSAVQTTNVPVASQAASVAMENHAVAKFEGKLPAWAARLRSAHPSEKAQNRSGQQLRLASDFAARQPTDTDNSSVGRGEIMPIMPLKLVPVAVGHSAIPQIGRSAALAVYGFVALILFARLFAGMWFSRKLERSAHEISPRYFTGDEDEKNLQSREALRLLRFRSSIAGLKGAPLLKESAAIAVPATVGVRRPVVLLPQNWRSWDERELDAILAHEISHVARHDALTQQLSLVHRAIFWFSPLAWWLDRRLVELAEQASDEAALAGGADRTRYAETLLGFFAQLSASRERVRWQGVSMASRAGASSAERRVERILCWKQSMSAKKSLLIAAAAFAAPVIFLAASLHPVIAHAQDKPQPKEHNVIVPGGPVAPALPNAPKGGVRGGVAVRAPQGGVTTPAPVAPPALNGPQIMIMPAVSADGQGVVNPGPMPSAPTVASVTPAVPATPQSTIVVGDSTDPQEAAEQLRAAEKALEQADMVSVAARLQQIHAAMAALRNAQQAASDADSVQMLEAQHALEKAQHLARVANAQQMREANVALAEARRDLHEAGEWQSTAAGDAQRAQEQTLRAVQDGRQTALINSFGYYDSGPRYVMVLGEKNFNMSGDQEDLDHARDLQKKISGPFIWFERDEKSYVITDPAFIAKAKALFAPEEELAKQQDELGRQQDELGRQQDALGEQMDKVKVKVPDITAELEQIRARLKELQASGATQSELGHVQSDLGRLQGEVGRFQSEAGVQQSEIGRQQGELGRKQGELGRKQGELGRRQGEIAREASKQLRAMFDDAIAKGIAKPE